MSESLNGFNLGSGNVAGMLAFLDYLVNKNLATASSITPIKSATKQVFLTVENGGEIDQLDLRTLDADEYFARFQIAAQSTGRFTPDSIRAYRNRFMRSLQMYSEYLETGATPKPAARTTTSRVKKDTSATPTAAPKPVPTSPEPIEPAAGATMISYPFPLEGGEVANLRLPMQLGKRDAARINAFINALVFEPAEPQKAIERVTGGEPLSAVS